jgi:hypothetical protein
VTRHNDWQRVSAVRSADGAHGPGPANPTRDVGIRNRFAIRDLKKLFQNGYLEVSAGQGQRQVEVPALAGEVFVELVLYIAKRPFVEYPVRVRIATHFATRESDDVQAVSISCNQQVADW